MSSESGFNFYCYGEVSVDKPEDTNIIEVFPKDIMYNLNGEIDNKQESVVINRTSTDGKVKTDKVSAKNVIAAVSYYDFESKTASTKDNQMLWSRLVFTF